MKKIYFVLLAILSFFLVDNVKANSIKSISMDIYLDKNGNAQITEVWQAYLTSGTEGYHPYYNLGNSYISDYSVMDDTGVTYKYSNYWDIDESFTEKNNKNGIYKDGNETDLCWGISKYGNRTYTLKYTIHNFIYNTTDDYQVLYWQLIPYKLSSKPSYAYIKVHADEPFSDTLDVWGYGVYGQPVYVSDGIIEFVAEKGLDSDEYMVLLAKFPNNTFVTNNSMNKTFESIYDMAQDGATVYSKPSENNSFFSIFYFLSLIGFITLINRAFKNSRKTNFIKNKIIPKNDVPYFRDLPCKDDIFKAYMISREYGLINKETDFLGSVLLKWIYNDNVSITKEETGIFKNSETKIIFKKKPEGNESENSLYIMMKYASKDDILESKEFEKYCRINYNEVLKWFSDAIENEYDHCKETDLLENNSQENSFIKVKYNATTKLNELAVQMAGLKRFFKDFTEISKKEPIEVKLWKEYLMYAQMFGMAKKVAKEFKELYPDVITDTTMDTFVMVNMFSTSSVNAASIAKSKAESYSSGGGGFSSGGGGGGSFGGGGGGGGFR